MTAGRRAAGITAALLLATLPSPAFPQDAGDPGDADPALRATPTTGGWGAVSVTPHDGTTVVAVAAAFPHGSADEPASVPGASWILGEAIEILVLEALDPAARASTEVSVEVGRGRTSVRLITLPRYWREAYGVLEWGVLRATPTPSAVTRAAARRADVSRFERDAPVREFEAELYGLVAGPGTPWSRDPRGEGELEPGATDPDSLAGLRDRLFRKAEGVVSVVGPVAPAEVLATIGDGPFATAPETAFEVSEEHFAGTAPLEGAGLPWSEPLRRVMTREVTSSWIGAVYPVDPGVGPTALELLLYRLDRAFNTDPPTPGAFHVDLRLERLDEHTLLLVEAAVLPEATATWESRIREGVQRVASRVEEGAFFRAVRRRFRAVRLMADEPPEVMAERAATDLLRDGAVRDLPAEIEALEAEDLRAAALGLGPPRVLVFGPDLSDDDPSDR